MTNSFLVLTVLVCAVGGVGVGVWLGSQSSSGTDSVAEEGANYISAAALCNYAAFEAIDHLNDAEAFVDETHTACLNEFCSAYADGQISDDTPLCEGTDTPTIGSFFATNSIEDLLGGVSPESVCAGRRLRAGMGDTRVLFTKMRATTRGKGLASGKSIITTNGISFSNLNRMTTTVCTVTPTKNKGGKKNFVTTVNEDFISTTGAFKNSIIFTNGKLALQVPITTNGLQIGGLTSIITTNGRGEVGITADASSVYDAQALGQLTDQLSSFSWSTEGQALNAERSAPAMLGAVLQNGVFTGSLFSGEIQLAGGRNLGLYDTEGNSKYDLKGFFNRGWVYQSFASDVRLRSRGKLTMTSSYANARSEEASFQDMISSSAKRGVPEMIHKTRSPFGAHGVIEYGIITTNGRVAREFGAVVPEGSKGAVVEGWVPEVGAVVPEGYVNEGLQYQDSASSSRNGAGCVGDGCISTAGSRPAMVIGSKSIITTNGIVENDGKSIITTNGNNAIIGTNGLLPMNAIIGTNGYFAARFRGPGRVLKDGASQACAQLLNAVRFHPKFKVECVGDACVSKAGSRESFKSDVEDPAGFGPVGFQSVGNFGVLTDRKTKAPLATISNDGISISMEESFHALDGVEIENVGIITTNGFLFTPIGTNGRVASNALCKCGGTEQAKVPRRISPSTCKAGQF